jgi:hypothetical protein
MTVFTRLKSGVMVAVALAIPILSNGCGDDNPLSPSNLCCTDFKVGADLTGVDFGVDASIKGSFGAFAQAAGDLSAVAAASLTDVTAACRAIAIDTGADPNDASVKDKTGADAAKGWCNLATAQIKAQLTGKFAAAGQLSIQVSPPRCEIEASFQAKCEGGCKADVSCTEPEISARCDPGQLSVQCSGSCTGSCEGSVSAAASCEGQCDASCEGSCEATGGVAVDCTGSCSGACTGTCEGAAGTTNSTGHCDGTCKGKCDAKCEVSANAPAVKCEGKCTGKCTGSCKFAADAKLKCDASCKGGCTGTATAPKCEADLKPPVCKGDVDCQANCKASGSARANCHPPEIQIAASGKLDASVQAEFDLFINTLQLNLPKLLLVFKSRGEAFVANIEAMGKAGGTIVADPGKLGVKGAACSGAIVSAAADALANMKVSVEASANVAGAVGVK